MIGWVAPLGHPSGRGRIVLRVTSAAGVEVAVAGPFEAGVCVGGEEIRGCLADLPLDPLRRCGPVRVPGVYRRQRHMPGRWFSTTARRFLEYESLLERDWMLLPACAEADVGYRVLSEPDRQVLMNVRWLAGFREPPADLDGERERMLAVLVGGPSTIAELLLGSWEVALARPVLMNMLWSGAAVVDVGIPIGAESRVWAPSRTGA